MEGLPLAAIAAAVRRERDKAGISLSELAKKAGIAKSTLSQIEAGQGNPSIETLWSLGVALGVPFSRLIEAPQQTVRVVRAGEGLVFASAQSDFRSALLAPGNRQEIRDVYLFHVEPGAPRVAEAHIPGSVEHLIVGGGRLRTGPADNLVELSAGDYISFPGDIPHLYEGLVAGTWAVLIMEHR